ncbi:MAG: lamin tail domain-containing protein, partial [Bacteroidota bacterium]|nr:lamin tail domain-containing protein [Bacteroidota bacterium]
MKKLFFLQQKLVVALLFSTINWGAALSQDDIRIICQSDVISGESVPVIIQFLSSNQEIDASVTGRFDLKISNGSLDKTSVSIVHGVGSILSEINGSGSARIEVEGYSGSKDILIHQSNGMTDVSGTLSFDQYWTSDNVYRISSNFTIPNGRTLIIDHGTRIYLDQDVNIIVYGTLEVDGRVDDPVLFTSRQRGSSWGGVEFQAGSSQSNVSFGIFTGGGGDNSRKFGHSDSQPVILAKNTDMNLDHCYIIDNEGKGIATNESNSTIENCLVSRCDTGFEFRYSNTVVDGSYILFLPDESGTADNDNDGIYFWNKKSSSAEVSQVKNSFIHFTGDEGIDFNEYCDVRVSNTFISEAKDKGFSISLDAEVEAEYCIIVDCDEGVVIKVGAFAIMNNLTIFRSRKGMQITSEAHGEVINSIIYASTGDAYYGAGSASIKYSIIDTEQVSGTGNIFGDPKLTNPQVWDFTLMANSPAIDAGDPSSGTDPDGTRKDIGAVPFVIPQADWMIPTELCYNPRINSVEDRGLEFLELRNVTENILDISGYYFSSGIELEFPEGAFITPGMYVLIVANKEDYFQTGAVVFEWESGSLSNVGEKLEIKSPSGTSVMEFTYSNSSPWPGSSELYNFPIELISEQSSFVGAESWQMSPNYGGTPGRANTRSPVSDLFINEFMAKNDGLIYDGFGNDPDWIEIFNASDEPQNLHGLFVSNDFDDRQDYQLNSNNFDESTIPAGGFKLLWASANSSGDFRHTSFTLPSAGGEICLGQVVGSQFTILDQVEYDQQTANISFGRFPDGSDSWQIFSLPTPGTSNADLGGGLIESLVINEFMARNTSSYVNENGMYDDWIEIYNKGSEAINVAGLYFTDSKDVPDMWQIPISDYSKTAIPPDGFLIIIPSGHPDWGVLHTNFQLAGGGEYVGVVQNYQNELHILDSISYPAQSNNISYGRITDGSDNWTFFSSSTPKTSNNSTGIFGKVFSDEPSLVLYPNPADATLNISFLSLYDPVSVDLIDYSGRIVNHWDYRGWRNLETNNNGLDRRIRVTSLTKGFYSLLIQTNKHQIV